MPTPQGMFGAERSALQAIPAPQTPFSLLGMLRGAGTGILDLMELGQTATRPEDIPPSAALAVPAVGGMFGAAFAPRGALAAGAVIPKFARAGRTSKFTLDELGGVGGDRGLEVLVNPNRQQIERFTKPERFSFANNEVRILKDPETGDIYAWRAGGATHHQVAEELGIDLFDPRVNQSVGNSVGPSHPAFNRSGSGLQTSANPATAAIPGMFGSMGPQQERAAILRGDLL